MWAASQPWTSSLKPKFSMSHILYSAKRPVVVSQLGEPGTEVPLGRREVGAVHGFLPIGHTHDTATGNTSVTASATALPFPDDSFGAVFGCGLLHHLPEALARQAVAEMMRVTRPCGHVILFDPVLPKAARLQSHERIREIIVLEIVLRREIVGFRLALLPDLLGMLGQLVHVVRNRSQVIEELAEHVPAAVASHHVCTQNLFPQARDGFPQQHALAVDRDIAEALVFRSPRPIGGLRCR